MSNAKKFLLTGDRSGVVTEQNGFTHFEDRSCVYSYLNEGGLLVSFECERGANTTDANMYTIGVAIFYETADGLYKLHSEDEKVITILCGIAYSGRYNIHKIGDIYYHQIVWSIQNQNVEKVIQIMQTLSIKDIDVNHSTDSPVKTCLSILSEEEKNTIFNSGTSRTLF
jgi:hypothetical protein